MKEETKRTKKMNNKKNFSRKIQAKSECNKVFDYLLVKCIISIVLLQFYLLVSSALQKTFQDTRIVCTAKNVCIRYQSTPYIELLWMLRVYIEYTYIEQVGFFLKRLYLALELCSRNNIE